MNKEKTAQMNEQSEDNVELLYNLLRKIPELERKVLELENKISKLINKE